MRFVLLLRDAPFVSRVITSPPTDRTARPVRRDEGMQLVLLHAVTGNSGTDTSCVLPLRLTDNETSGAGAAAQIFILRG